MRYPTLIILVIFISSIAMNAVGAPKYTNSTMVPSPAANRDQKGSDLEKKKKKLQEDAQELIRNFKDIFENLTGISKAILRPFVDDVSKWIKNNYAKLSKQSRKELRESMEELRKRLNKLENRSKERADELFRDFKDLLDSLKEKDEKEIPPEMIPA